jgi:hypothetical protein
MTDRLSMLEDRYQAEKIFFYGGLLHFGTTALERDKKCNEVLFFACREVPPSGLGA